MKEIYISSAWQRILTLRQVKVISLDAVQSIDEAMVGAKAMSLCRMSQIGLKVPSGFCITATVFREDLETEGIKSCK